MDFYIIIPAYNEEAYLAQTLQSLLEQTVLPKKIVVVNDGSTDGTQAITEKFSEEHSFISSVSSTSKAAHEPGSKVIQAFNKGLKTLDNHYDIICKFDADLIFPKHYLETLQSLFLSGKKVGMAGGFCYIQNNGNWQIENLTNKDHLRGALKAYTQECFTAIGGLKNTMGWDTVDELLAAYNGYHVVTEENLHVKHLKPTGKSYTKAARHKQGMAFYKMRYGLVLTVIASAKLALKKRSSAYFIDCLFGFYHARRQQLPYIVSEKEGVFIKNLRWKGIKKKLFFVK